MSPREEILEAAQLLTLSLEENEDQRASDPQAHAMFEVMRDWLQETAAGMRPGWDTLWTGTEPPLRLARLVLAMSEEEGQ